jgi:hypothetical protein
MQQSLFTTNTTKFRKGQNIAGLGTIKEVFVFKTFNQYQIGSQFFHENILVDYLLERELFNASIDTLNNYLHSIYISPSDFVVDRVKKINFLLFTNRDFAAKINRYPSNKVHFLKGNLPGAMTVVNQLN